MKTIKLKRRKGDNDPTDAKSWYPSGRSTPKPKARRKATAKVASRQPWSGNVVLDPAMSARKVRRA